METRFYQTQELDLQRIAQALVLEYQPEWARKTGWIR